MGHVANDAPGGKSAMLVKIAVETDNFMARLEQHRNHDGADIAQVPSDQHAHDYFSFAIPAVVVPDADDCSVSERPQLTFMATVAETAGTVSESRQGMRPCSTMSSSTSLSFNVSIGRQKPSCLKARSCSASISRRKGSSTSSSPSRI